jgi:hypothetical protein
MLVFVVSLPYPEISDGIVIVPKFMLVKMDRRWINNSEPFSQQFLAGVQQFIDHVEGRYSEDEQIKCPCRKCLNQREKSIDEVLEDIEINGMSKLYTR